VLILPSFTASKLPPAVGVDPVAEDVGVARELVVGGQPGQELLARLGRVRGVEEVEERVGLDLGELAAGLPVELGLDGRDGGGEAGDAGVGDDALGVPFGREPVVGRSRQPTLAGGEAEVERRALALRRCGVLAAEQAHQTGAWWLGVIGLTGS